MIFKNVLLSKQSQIFSVIRKKIKITSFFVCFHVFFCPLFPLKVMELVLKTLKCLQFVIICLKIGGHKSGCTIEKNNVIDAILIPFPAF